MAEATIIHGINLEDLKDLINACLKEHLDEVFEALKREKNETLLSREEAAKFLKINPTTLWRWTGKGELISYSKCNQLYYKKSEILDSLTPSKI